MKKIILIVFPLVALCCGTVVAQADADKIWDDANTAYINADYVAAIDGYEKLLDSGLESDRLYLNLGNAYFKRGMNGKAILNYNRALKLAPSDDDIRYNLSIANAYVQDKIDAVPVFFAKRWLIGLGNSLSSNAWAALSLLFFGALVSVAAFALAVVYAAVGRSQRIHPAEAIVMSTAAPVKSSPDPQSKDIFVLHEGTKVAVGDSLGDWREIRIADGNKGWVQVSAIEMID